MSTCLRNLLLACQEFCSLSPSSTRHELVLGTFNREANLLIRLLTSLRQHGHGADSSLAQFLTRLDYNRFFSKTEKKT